MFNICENYFLVSCKKKKWFVMDLDDLGSIKVGLDMDVVVISWNLLKWNLMLIVLIIVCIVLKFLF